MYKVFLLPNIFKKIGWVVFIPSSLIGLVLCYFDYEPSRISPLLEKIEFNTIIIAFILISGMFVGFSKEKEEDEYITSLRLNSLIWAVVINYTILLFSNLFIYGIPFVNVMIYNMFTVLFIYIILFNSLLFRSLKISNNAE